MTLEKAIQKTIDYANKFGSEINSKEIIDRLISKNIYSEKEINNHIPKDFFKNKINLWKRNKLLKAKELATFLKNGFPNILFLGVSGSVASGHPQKNDDIDLIIITKKNKLWLTRFKLRTIIFLKKIPHRKYGQKEIKDEFCFNLWLDQDGLTLPKEKQTLQSATDLLMIIPLFDRQNIYQKLLLRNDWAKKYLATGYSKLINRSLMIDDRKKEKNNYFDKMINKLFFWPQYWYMREKITEEMVNFNQAFFHKRNDRMRSCGKEL